MGILTAQHLETLYNTVHTLKGNQILCCKLGEDKE